MHHAVPSAELARRCEEIAEPAADRLADLVDSFFQDDNDHIQNLLNLLVIPLRLDIEDDEEDQEIFEALKTLIQDRVLKKLGWSIQSSALSIQAKDINRVLGRD